MDLSKQLPRASVYQMVGQSKKKKSCLFLTQFELLDAHYVKNNF